MKHAVIALLLAALFVPCAARAADEEVPVPVPELNPADPSLPGADTAAPEADVQPAAAPATNKAPAASAADASGATPATNAPAPSASATPVAAKSFPPDTVFTVQLGAFQTRERAFSLYWELSKKLSPLQVTAPSAKDKLYRVRYGSYPNYAEAKAAADKVKARSIECFVAALNQEGENISVPPNQK